MNPPHVFDEAVALETCADGSFQGRTSPAYANFIGPYGGITAAQCLNAVLCHPDRLGDPVAFTVNFAAAVASARAISGHSSSSHCRARLASACARS